MRKIIPEKMVEIWTAQAVLGSFGSSARIWAPTQGFDQAVQPDRGKRFILELKAPDWTKHTALTTGFPPSEQLPVPVQPVAIDIGQLLEYVETFEPEVLYVLPQPAHYQSRTGKTHMELEGEEVRISFPGWAYVVCSSRLLQLIGNDRRLQDLQSRPRCSAAKVWPADRRASGRYARNKTARVICDTASAGIVQCRWLNGAPGSGVQVINLGRFLALLDACIFDWPLVARSSGLPSSELTIGEIPEGLRPVDGLIDPPRVVDDVDFDGVREPAEYRRLPGQPLVVEIRM